MNIKKLLVLGAVLVLSVGCVKSPAKKQDSDTRSPVERIKAMKVFQKPGIEIKKVVDRGELHQVVLSARSAQGRKQNFDAFVTKDYTLSVIGKGFDKFGKELIIPVNMKKYDKYAAFKYGTGKKKYYVFTDPECPYCKRFESELKSNVEIRESATIYFFFYPLPNHKNAANIAMYSMAQDTDEEKFDALSNGQWRTNPLSAEQKAKYSKVINLHKGIANTLGLKGTPTVFDSNGKFVSWPSLLR
ncbi:MAG: Thiol:disulfide interchange protein DsbC [uncultured Campylobacterales bacterium]|uniref:Thiol:disulfide interchange protein DsbC n=1 Tax=uncultured Campylobacterales bacterium TaxID=352960 RepID=A0A6S6SJ92_9BACT|nr:MAG: Thiol:disulfide interchange protein DsbC [uncultured Campylobacterales bacterium]